MPEPAFVVCRLATARTPRVRLPPPPVSVITQAAMERGIRLSAPPVPVEPTGGAKRACIIANSNYPRDIGVLKNPVHDGEAMAAALKRMDYDEVMLCLDVGIEEFDQAVQVLHTDPR